MEAWTRVAVWPTAVVENTTHLPFTTALRRTSSWSGSSHDANVRSQLARVPPLPCLTFVPLYAVTDARRSSG